MLSRIGASFQGLSSLNKYNLFQSLGNINFTNFNHQRFLGLRVIHNKPSFDNSGRFLNYILNIFKKFTLDTSTDYSKNRIQKFHVTRGNFEEVIDKLKNNNPQIRYLKFDFELGASQLKDVCMALEKNTELYFIKWYKSQDLDQDIVFLIQGILTETSAERYASARYEDKYNAMVVYIRNYEKLYNPGFIVDREILEEFCKGIEETVSQYINTIKKPEQQSVDILNVNNSTDKLLYEFYNFKSDYEKNSKDLPKILESSLKIVLSSSCEITGRGLNDNKYIVAPALRSDEKIFNEMMENILKGVKNNYLDLALRRISNVNISEEDNTRPIIIDNRPDEQKALGSKETYVQKLEKSENKGSSLPEL